MYLINFIFQTEVGCIITEARRGDHNMGSQSFWDYRCSTFRCEPSIGCRCKSMNLSDLKNPTIKSCIKYLKQAIYFLNTAAADLTPLFCLASVN